MKRFFFPACIVTVLGILLFGFVYPMCIWIFGHIFFPWQSEASPLYIDNTKVGLQYVGQQFSKDIYFWSRPSWAYKYGDMLISGGSHLSWSSPLLRANVISKSNTWIQQVGYVPEDMVTASASGCDPDISLAAAYAQVPRVAKARNISREKLYVLIAECEEISLGLLFPKRVNVLLLNLKLDALH